MSDLATLAPVATPARITAESIAGLAAIGSPVTERRTLYLVRPERDLVWVETVTGEVRCGPGSVILYDPDAKTASVLSAAEAAARYALVEPSATAPKPAADPAPPSEAATAEHAPETEPEQPGSSGAAT